jgi:hypothetical protein
MKITEKGPTVAPPAIPGPAGRVAAEAANWPGVLARAHWHLYHPTQVDGADFYVGTEELGHVHLDGEAHIAMTRAMRDAALAAGIGHPAPWRGYEGWLHLPIRTEADADAALSLFRDNYARLTDMMKNAS